MFKLLGILCVLGVVRAVPIPDDDDYRYAYMFNKVNPSVQTYSAVNEVKQPAVSFNRPLIRFDDDDDNFDFDDDSHRFFYSAQPQTVAVRQPVAVTNVQPNTYSANIFRVDDDDRYDVDDDDIRFFQAAAQPQPTVMTYAANAAPDKPSQPTFMTAQVASDASPTNPQQLTARSISPLTYQSVVVNHDFDDDVSGEVFRSFVPTDGSRTMVYSGFRDQSVLKTGNSVGKVQLISQPHPILRQTSDEDHDDGNRLIFSAHSLPIEYRKITNNNAQLMEYNGPLIRINDDEHDSSSESFDTKDDEHSIVYPAILNAESTTFVKSSEAKPNYGLQHFKSISRDIPVVKTSQILPYLPVELKKHRDYDDVQKEVHSSANIKLLHTDSVETSLGVKTSQTFPVPQLTHTDDNSREVYSSSVDLHSSNTRIVPEIKASQIHQFSPVVYNIQHLYNDNNKKEHSSIGDRMFYSGNTKPSQSQPISQVTYDVQNDNDDGSEEVYGTHINPQLYSSNRNVIPEVKTFELHHASPIVYREEKDFDDDSRELHSSIRGQMFSSANSETSQALPALTMTFGVQRNNDDVSEEVYGTHINPQLYSSNRNVIPEVKTFELHHASPVVYREEKDFDDDSGELPSSKRGQMFSSVNSETSQAIPVTYRVHHDDVSKEIYSSNSNQQLYLSNIETVPDVKKSPLVEAHNVQYNIGDESGKVHSSMNNGKVYSEMVKPVPKDSPFSYGVQHGIDDNSRKVSSSVDFTTLPEIKIFSAHQVYPVLYSVQPNFDNDNVDLYGSSRNKKLQNEMVQSSQTLPVSEVLYSFQSDDDDGSLEFFSTIKNPLLYSYNIKTTPNIKIPLHSDLSKAYSVNPDFNDQIRKETASVKSHISYSDNTEMASITKITDINSPHSFNVKYDSDDNHREIHRSSNADHKINSDTIRAKPLTKTGNVVPALPVDYNRQPYGDSDSIELKISEISPQLYTGTSAISHIVSSSQTLPVLPELYSFQHAYDLGSKKISSDQNLSNTETMHEDKSSPVPKVSSMVYSLQSNLNDDSREVYNSLYDGIWHSSNVGTLLEDAEHKNLPIEYSVHKIDNDESEEVHSLISGQTLHSVNVDASQIRPVSKLVSTALRSNDEYNPNLSSANTEVGHEVPSTQVQASPVVYSTQTDFNVESGEMHSSINDDKLNSGGIQVQSEIKSAPIQEFSPLLLTLQHASEEDSGELYSSVDTRTYNIEIPHNEHSSQIISKAPTIYSVQNNFDSESREVYRSSHDPHLYSGTVVQVPAIKTRHIQMGSPVVDSAQHVFDDDSKELEDSISGQILNSANVDASQIMPVSKVVYTALHNKNEYNPNLFSANTEVEHEVTSTQVQVSPVVYSTHANFDVESGEIHSSIKDDKLNSGGIQLQSGVKSARTQQVSPILFTAQHASEEDSGEQYSSINTRTDNIKISHNEHSTKIQSEAPTIYSVQNNFDSESREVYRSSHDPHLYSGTIVQVPEFKVRLIQIDTPVVDSVQHDFDDDSKEMEDSITGRMLHLNNVKTSQAHMLYNLPHDNDNDNSEEVFSYSSNQQLLPKFFRNINIIPKVKTSNMQQDSPAPFKVQHILENDSEEIQNATI